MSTEKYDRYKELYSRYIAHAVTVHNYHYVFLRTLGKAPGVQVRRSLSEMINIEKELRKLSHEVYKENNINLKEKRIAEKKGFTKLGRAGPGRPKKNKEIKNDNINTTN
jgi:hypothetical protein